jgi:arabinan endo-1,5-alpha-L-arabinosidase
MKNRIIKTKIMFTVLISMLLFSVRIFGQNPIVTDVFTADPSAMVHDGTVYLYTGHDEATTDDTDYVMNEWLVYSSTDMVNWTAHGPKLSVNDFSWAWASAFAGHCIERNEKFYWYVPMLGGGDYFSIGVAVADSPLGPFTDALGEPLIADAQTPDLHFDIDPAVFIDDDGQAYMYWGNATENGLMKVVKLNEDMISTTGGITTVDVPYFTEAPYVHKKGDTYYLSYASGWPERIVYATGSSPMGPWTYQGVLNELVNSYTNHQSIIEYKGTDYFVYHNAVLPTGGDYRRSVCIDYLYYNADGTIQQIVPTTEGVQSAADPTYTYFNDNMEWQQHEKWMLAHDPTFIREENGTFSLMQTNNMLTIQQGTDMINYRNTGQVFSQLPDWVAAEGVGSEDIWAPQITYRDGFYWCYYTVSEFGKNNSAIGLAVTPTLDVNSPDYKWTDRGMVFRSYTQDNYNCIDADALVDNDGRWWMVFGSWWSGIQLVELDLNTGTQKAGTTVKNIAGRGGGAIEGPSIIEHGGEYFLFTAWDKCCDGVNSTYRTMVGKANSMTGTFYDRNGRDLANSGGTEVLSHYGRYYGPGGGSAVKIDNRYYFIHHYYNGNNNGTPSLQTREIIFDNTNFPYVTQPFLGRKTAYEAEHGEMINCEITTGTGNASGDEYVGMINDPDSRVVFHVNALQSGDYKLVVRYATGDGAASHTVEVNNDSYVLSYPVSDAWGTFPEGQFVELNVSLQKGYNKISFIKNSGFAELDRFDLVKFADQQIYAGTFDGSNSPVFNKEENSVVLENDKWIQYENIHFKDGGYSNVNLTFNGSCNGTVTIALNGVNGSIQASKQISINSGQESIALNSDFSSVSGIYDVYISSTGTCALQSFEFRKESVSDCNGDLNGTAYLDDCGRCVSGNTGISPCTAYESEDISEYLGIVETTNTGFTGTGYVNTDNVLDSYITFYLNAEQAVNVPIMVRYANGSTDNRDASVSINHTEVYANIEFLNTGGWTSWDTKEINLSLDQGVNIITFMSTTTNGLANIDKIWYYDPTVTIASAEDTVQNQDPQEIQLKAGWNLIGYPLITTQTLENALSGIWSQVEVVKDMSGFYLRNQDPALQSLTEMEWGKGYFLKVDADCVLSWNQ